MSAECEACGMVGRLRDNLCVRCSAALDTHRAALAHLQALYRSALEEWLNHWQHEPYVMTDAPHLAQQAGTLAADELEGPSCAKHRC